MTMGPWEVFVQTLESTILLIRIWIPIFVALWRWWLWPGMWALAIIVYLLWVSVWEHWGRRILGYFGGAAVLIAVWSAETSKALNSKWQLGINSEGVIGFFTFDLTLSEALGYTLVRMVVGLILMCGIIYLFLRILLFIVDRIGEARHRRKSREEPTGEEAPAEEISEEAPPEEEEELKKEELRCAYCGRKLKGDPDQCPHCGGDT